MIPLAVMIGATLIARGLGAVGALPTGDWASATRVGLGIMFLFTATAHFSKTRGDLIRMVPPAFPNAAALVTATGVAEIAGALGLLIPSFARWAATGLILLLMAMFPANVHAARAGVTIRGRAPTPLVLRLLMQLVWMLLLWWSAIGGSA